MRFFLVAAAVGTTAAQELCSAGMWDEAKGGDWTDTDAWMNGAIPDENDIAVFIDGEYDVLVLGDAEAASVTINGDVTLSIGDETGDTEAVLVIGGSAGYCSDNACPTGLTYSSGYDLTGAGSGMMYDASTGASSTGYASYDLACADGYEPVWEDKTDNMENLACSATGDLATASLECEAGRFALCSGTSWGTADGDWNVASNWEGSEVPTEYDVVSLTSTDGYTVTLTEDAAAFSVDIDGSDGGVFIDITDGWLVIGEVGDENPTCSESVCDLDDLELPAGYTATPLAGSSSFNMELMTVQLDDVRAISISCAEGYESSTGEDEATVEVYCENDASYRDFDVTVLGCSRDTTETITTTEPPADDTTTITEADTTTTEGPAVSALPEATESTVFDQRSTESGYYAGAYGGYYLGYETDVDCDEFLAAGSCADYCGMLTDGCGIICDQACLKYGDCGDFFEVCPFETTTTMDPENFIEEDADNAAIGSGRKNLITTGSDYALIAGGKGNTVVNAADATILGGWRNAAYSKGSTITGGFEGLALGRYSTIVGGSRNTVSARHSLAGGFKATTKGTMSMVLGFAGNTDGVTDQDETCELDKDADNTVKFCGDQIFVNNVDMLAVLSSARRLEGLTTWSDSVEGQLDNLQKRFDDRRADVLERIAAQTQILEAQSQLLQL